MPFKIDLKALAVAVHGITKAEAHEKFICIDCKKTPKFHTLAGRREYVISGYCEPCFDKIAEEGVF